MRTVHLVVISKIKGGKGTAANRAVKMHGARTVKYSTPLREISRDMGLEETRENLQNLSTSVRARLREDVLATAIIDRCNAMADARIILIDGARRRADIDGLRQKDPFFRSLYVPASVETRFARQVANPENPGDETMSFEEFKIRDQAEAEREIELIGDLADYKIVNDHISLEAYYMQFDSILHDLLMLPDPPGT